MNEDMPDRRPNVPDEERPRKRVSLLDASDTLDLVVYGGGAAAIVGFVLWLIVGAIWETGSVFVRSTLLGLLALAVVIVVNDIHARRLSLLSKLLVGTWALVAVLLVIAEIFVGM